VQKEKTGKNDTRRFTVYILDLILLGTITPRRREVGDMQHARGFIQTFAQKMSASFERARSRTVNVILK
jgi:hypothetical protein